MPTYEYKGHEFEADHELSKEEWSQTLAYFDSIGEKKADPRKTGILEDVGIGLADLGHTAATAAQMVAGGATRLVGAEDTSDAIFDSMVERTKTREEYKKGLDQGFSGKAISGIAGILPMLAAAPITGPLAAATGMATMSGLSSAEENVRGGASTGQAMAQFGSEVGTDALANALPIGKGLLKGAALGAGGNVASQAAQDLTGSQLIGGEKYDPSAEKYALQAVTGAVPGAVFGRMNKDGKFDLPAKEPVDEPIPDVPLKTQTEFDNEFVTRTKGQIESIERQLYKAHQIQDELSKTGSMTEKQYEFYQKKQEEIDELNKELGEKKANLSNYSDNPLAKTQEETTLENLKNFDPETLEVVPKKPVENEPPPLEDGYLESLGKPKEDLLTEVPTIKAPEVLVNPASTENQAVYITAFDNVEFHDKFKALKASGAFDKLSPKGLQKELDRKTQLYSELKNPNGGFASRLKTEIEYLIERLNTTTGSIPKLSTDENGLIKAVAFKDQDTVVYNQEVYNTLTPQQKHGLSLHEIGVHIGMERMVGAEKFKQILQEVSASRFKGEAFRKAFESVPKDTKKEHVNEEALAYLIENHANLPIVRKILNEIKSWFNKEYRGVYLQEKELYKLAVASLKQAETYTKVVGVDSLSTKPKEGFVKIDFQKSLESNPVIRDIFESIMDSGNGLVRLVGSLGMSGRVNIYRPANEQIHDLDFIVHSKDVNNFYRHLKETIPGSMYAGAFRTKGSDYHSAGVAVPLSKDLELVSSSRIPTGGYVMHGRYKGSDEIVPIPKSEYLHIDFFVKDNPIESRETVDYTRTDGTKVKVPVESVEASFKEKFRFSREKDYRDAILADQGNPMFSKKESPIKGMTTPKMTAASDIASSLSKPVYDPDITVLKTAEELIANPEAKDMTMGMFKQFERAYAGMGQYVEAIKKQAPVVWETYKRLKIAIDKETELKRTLWYGDAAKEEVKGMGPVMKLTHYEQADTMAHLEKTLKTKDIAAIQDFLSKNQLEQRDHLRSLKEQNGAGLTPEQQKAVEVIATFLDKIQKAAGFRYRKGYLPNMRKGEFAVGIKTKLGDLTHLEFFKTEAIAKEWAARAKKNGLNAMDVIDLRTEEGMRMAEAFDVMREVMAKDPDTLEALDKTQQGIAEHAKGAHNKFKEGYSGGLGQSLFKNREQNAKDFFKSLEAYGNQVAAGIKKNMVNKSMAKFLDNSEGGAKLKEMFPNQVETSKYLADIVLNNQGKYGWAESVDKIKGGFDNLWVAGAIKGEGIIKKFDKSFDAKLYYPEVPILDKGLGMVSQLFYIRVLTSRPAFWAGQLLSSPFALRQVLKEGTLAETITAQGKGWGTIMSGGDMEFKQFVKKFANTTDSLHPQFKNEINEISFLDSKTNTGLSKMFQWASGQTPAGMADSASRYMTLATAYHFYKDRGLTGDALFRNAQNMVDNTMVMYGRTYTSPFLQKSGLLGTQMAPLQKYGIAQMENLIGDFRHIAEGKNGVEKLRNMGPAISTMLTTMIMAGSMGLPLLMEYEALRMAFVMTAKFFGWDSVEEYVPRSVMEMIMGDSRVKDAFTDGLYNTTGISKNTGENIMTHGVLSAATGFDVGSSLRFNPILPESKENISLLNAFPVVKEAFTQAGNVALGIKNVMGGDVSEAEKRKALMSMQFVAGQNALVDHFRFDAGTREAVPGGNRYYGQVKQTPKEQVSTAIGSATMEKSRATILGKIAEKQKDKRVRLRQDAADFVRDGIRTGNDSKIDRGMEMAQKAGMTSKELMRMVKTGMYNEATPNMERMYTDNKGRVKSKTDKEVYLGMEEFMQE